MTLGLNTRHIRAIEARGISAETALKFGLHTGRHTGKGIVVPDLNGDVLVFPYFEKGVVVNDKYRAPGKKFWQRTDGIRTFYNSDIMDDAALKDGGSALVLTEGELDCIAVSQSATPFVVSVPDGASKPPDGRALDDLDPVEQSAQKFSFMVRHHPRLKLIKRFIIATDDDPPGIRLRHELARLLLPGKCSFVEYPKERVVPVLDNDGVDVGRRPCKDFNEVLQYIGVDAVAEVLKTAKPYPTRGLYEFGDFPKQPPLECASTGWKELDELMKPFPGELMLVLGLPAHGKSAFVANLIANFSEQYGWRSALFSPEEPADPFLLEKFRSIRARRSLMPIETVAIEACDDWIKDSFKLITLLNGIEEENDLTLEWVLLRAKEAVMRFGIKVLVIDPWNELEHARKHGESQTEYTGRALRMLNDFRRTHNVMIIVLVHPTKEVGKDGKMRAPTPYDADGSAHFFNKADHFVIIHRPDKEKNETYIRVAKVKFKGTGKDGTEKFSFDTQSCRYQVIEEQEEPRRESLSSGEGIRQ